MSIADLTLDIACLGQLIISAEMINASRELADDGLMSWQVARLRNSHLVTGWIGWSVNAVLRYGTARWLLLFQGLLAAVVVLAIPTSHVGRGAVLALAVTTVAIVFRSRYGLDGADQMILMILVAFAVAYLMVPAGVASTFALTFVAVQICFCYVCAGVSKLVSSGWRDGTYLPRILATEMFGLSAFVNALMRNRGVAVSASWAVMIWESTFWVVLLGPPWLVFSYLATGVVFHASNAMIMGLNTFVWAFIATYPAILWWSSR